MIKIVDGDIDVGEVIGKLDQQGAGSVVFHLGVVKPDPEGKKSEGIVFGMKGDMEAELRSIEKDLRAQLKLIDVILIRRLGTLKVGDSILVAAVSAKGRVDAFAACREAVERFRRMKTIDKKELLVGD
jgi:molybdopterin synthase catalytic subunit